MEGNGQTQRNYYIYPKHLGFSASIFSHVGVANVISIIKRQQIHRTIWLPTK